METSTLAEDLRTIIEQAALLGTPPRKVGREEVDQINIIARWIHRHSEDEQRSFFPLPEHLSDSNDIGRFLDHVVEAVLTPPDTGEDGEVADETEIPASAPVSEG
jgi:hypothetical protein